MWMLETGLPRSRHLGRARVDVRPFQVVDLLPVGVSLWVRVDIVDLEEVAGIGVIIVEPESHVGHCEAGYQLPVLAFLLKSGLGIYLAKSI